MSATHSSPDPLAAVPLLREAGVSVYWQQLEGRTAWMADAESRQVWLSRSIPGDSIVRYLVEALQALDDGGPASRPTGSAASAPGPRLVHSADRVEAPAPGRPATLAVVRDG